MKVGVVLGARFELLEAWAVQDRRQIWRARDLQGGLEVAVDLLASGAPLDGDRFAREIQQLGTLSSPHVIRLLASGAARGAAWFATPWLGRERLSSRLDSREALHFEDTAALGRGLLMGLAHAHERGVVHRDVRPENVILADGDVRRPVVVGFEFGRHEDGRDVRSTSGAIVGGLRYMPPEQLMGQTRIGPEADVYGAGCVLFECIGGQPAFSGPAPQLPFRVMQGERDDLRDFGRLEGEPLYAVVDRMLSPEPSERYPNAGRALAAFQRAMAEVEACADDG